jgi:hypothetical protein
VCDATAVSGYKGAKQDGLQDCNIGIVYCSQLFLQVGNFLSCQHEVGDSLPHALPRLAAVLSTG